MTKELIALHIQHLVEDLQAERYFEGLESDSMQRDINQQRLELYAKGLSDMIWDEYKERVSERCRVIVMNRPDPNQLEFDF